MRENTSNCRDGDEGVLYPTMSLILSLTLNDESYFVNILITGIQYFRLGIIWHRDCLRYSAYSLVPMKKITAVPLSHDNALPLMLYCFIKKRAVPQILSSLKIKSHTHYSLSSPCNAHMSNSDPISITWGPQVICDYHGGGLSFESRYHSSFQ